MRLLDQSVLLQRRRQIGNRAFQLGQRCFRLVQQGCQFAAGCPLFLQQDFVIDISPCHFKVCLQHFQLRDVTHSEAVVGNLLQPLRELEGIGGLVALCAR